MAACGPCSQLLADARRGAAFLEMLRTPAPEPPAALLERILAETSGPAVLAARVHACGTPTRAAAGHLGVAALVPGHAIPAAALRQRASVPAARGRGVPGQLVWPDHAAAAAGHDGRDGVLLHRADHEPHRRPSAARCAPATCAEQPEARLLLGQRAAWCSTTKACAWSTSWSRACTTGRRAQDSDAAQPSDQPTGQSAPANPDQPGNPLGQPGSPARPGKTPRRQPGSNPPARKQARAQPRHQPPRRPQAEPPPGARAACG